MVVVLVLQRPPISSLKLNMNVYNFEKLNIKSVVSRVEYLFEIVIGINYYFPVTATAVCLAAFLFV